MRRLPQIAATALCAMVLVSADAFPQDMQAVTRDEPDGAWLLAGVDVGIRHQWRGTIRFGQLGDIDSRILITELAVRTVPALHLIGGHVLVQPRAASADATSLLRGGVTWLPWRGRLTLDNRALVERRSGGTGSAVARGRNRLRLTWNAGTPLHLAASGSVETIAAVGTGVVEHRLQAGAAGSVRRATVEVYWLHRRIRARPVFNGIGVTLYWRLGTA